MDAAFLHRATRIGLLIGAALTAQQLAAQAKADCTGLPDAGRLRSVLQSVVKEGAANNGGMGNQEWAVVVNRDGVGCAVVFSGVIRSDEWPGSRMIAAEKANAATRLAIATTPSLPRTSTRHRSPARAYTV